MNFRDRRGLLALLGTAAVLLSTSCGGGAEEPSPEQGANSSAEAGGEAAEGDGQVAADGGTGASGAGAAQEEEPPPLPKMRLGPSGPGDPLWYDPIREMDCADEHLVASRGQQVPLAGHLLCRAATENDDALWAQGEEVLAGLGVPKNCWEQETVTALQDLVEFHRQHPEASPSFEDRPGTACPLVLESIETPLAPGVVGSEIPVSVCGGAPVFLHGNIEYLPAGSVRAVTVGATRVPVQEGNGGLFFRAPASSTPGVAAVRVTESEEPVSGEASLVYHLPTTSCPSPPPAPPAASGSAQAGG